MREVTIDCGTFGEDEIKELKEMQSLARFKLVVEEIKCDAMQIISFVQSNLQLNHVSIICGPESQYLEFDDDFKSVLHQMNCDRSELSINITFNKPSEKQSINITKEGIVETHVPRYDEDDTDDDDSSIVDDDVDAKDDTNAYDDDDDTDFEKSTSDAAYEQ